ncbi:MAG TPA: Na+/H+ antiporter subunit B [Candidatus Hydrogenedentes bacterium]|nr:Na+/H+ antiporter subunit B [Candidatus Hydrogenedentota bacterium]HOJ69300.1 Na+/H+ antiporter subunit B [Candidatus Hydrogenedentota bacterium]HOK90277.1 Na+/H+ antiporter subunit B [Candidatus Hydrogenedentota bacterium]HOV61142.1 Na+/H+ antiporter subunit B [Candidatus Hydrogenedentota bacterium]
MNSVILRSGTMYLRPLLLIFSVFLLLGGHNQPGGGFTGGLVAASAFVLEALAFGLERARQTLRVHPLTLVGCGLTLAALSAAFSVPWGKPFMTGMWDELHVPGLGEVAVGTPFFFDLGVYFDVLGVTCLIIFTLLESASSGGKS